MKPLPLILVLIMFGFSTAAQDSGNDDYDPIQQQVDSILAIIKDNTSDSVKALLYNEIGEISDNPDTIIKYSNLSLNLCGEGDTMLLASNYNYLGYSYYMQDESERALMYYCKSLNYYQLYNNQLKEALVSVSIAKCCHDLSLTDSCFMFFDRALDCFNALHDTSNLSFTYTSIGDVNYELGFKENAQNYYHKALQLDSAAGNYLDMAVDYQELATTSENIHQALMFAKKSSEIFDSIPTDDYYYIECKYSTYLYLAKFYIGVAKQTSEVAYADSCNFYINKIGQRFIDFGEYTNHIVLCYTFADYLSFCGKPYEAIKAMRKCEKYIDEDCNKTLLSKFYGNLSSLYQSVGDYKAALDYFIKKHNYETQYANDSTLNVIAAFKTEQAVKIQTAENLRLSAEQNTLKIIIISLVSGLILVSALVFYIVRVLHIKHKTNKQILAQKEEIEIQKDVITHQWREVEEVNNKLLDSISYAQKIQSAALSKKEEIDSLFPENFVYYRPRDIVSGDFYRVVKCGKYNVFITADCTGHGIPGAFLSMLGISALKEYCVTEQDAENPGTILDRLRVFFKSTLISDTHLTGDNGMDITVLSFDFEAMKLCYAAANHIVYVIRNGNVIKLKGDRMPVGRYIVERKHFTSFQFDLNKGDMVYSFSDGVYDQLGGDLSVPSGKKFLFDNLQSLLVSVSTQPMDIQLQTIDNTINQWRNGRPQIDDMTLVGIKI